MVEDRACFLDAQRIGMSTRTVRRKPARLWQTMRILAGGLA